MSRSGKKGPYVDPKLLKKIAGLKPGDKTVVKTWSRASEISPEMVGFTFGVHNGKNFIEVKVSEDMIGHHFGEFALTRKFIKHGGQMQRDLEKGTTQPGAPAAPGQPVSRTPQTGTNKPA